jgi:hypothetical protein
LLSTSGYSVTQYRSLSGLWFQFQNSKSSFLLCLHTHVLNALLAEYLFHRIRTVLLSLCTHALRSMPSWQSLSESSTEFWSSSELTAEFSFSAPRVHAQCPLGRAPQNLQQGFCLQLCPPSHSLPLEVFNNLKGLLLLPELLISTCASARLCLTPQSSEVQLYARPSEPQRSVTPTWCEASKTLNLKSNQLPAMHNHNTHCSI